MFGKHCGGWGWGGWGGFDQNMHAYGFFFLKKIVKRKKEEVSNNRKCRQDGCREQKWRLQFYQWWNVKQTFQVKSRGYQTMATQRSHCTLLIKDRLKVQGLREFESKCWEIGCVDSSLWNLTTTWTSDKTDLKSIRAREDYWFWEHVIRGELTLSNTYGTGRESPKYIKQKPKWETIIVCNWWVRRATPSENTEPRGSTAKSFVCYQGSPEAWGTGCWKYIRNSHQGRQYPYRLQHLWSHTGNCTQPWSELKTSNNSMFSFLNHRIFGH